MITYQHSNLHFAKNAVFLVERCGRVSHLHWHDAVEFVYVLSGALSVTLNGTSFMAVSGDIIAVDSAMVHSYEPSEGGADYYFLVADDGFFKANNLYSQSTSFEPLIRSDEARRLFGEIIKETEKGDRYSNVSTLSVLISLFVYMNRHHARVGTDTPSSEKKRIALVRSALVYIEEHYKERLSVGEIADALHFSESYLSHTFKEITNYSVISYINLLRCRNARALILDGSSIGEAAEECGFSDLSYFTRVFKRSMGILPSEVEREIFSLTDTSAR